MKKWAVLILLLVTLFLFWKINIINYWKHLQIRNNFVKHPENLPNPEFAKKTAIWFKNLRADIYRLETIQYIWSNAINSKYKKYLFNILDLVTELNPYFAHPYKIWMLLLPDYNKRYETLTKKEELFYIKQAETLWLKWIKNFCNKDKINLIKSEYDLRKIWTEEKYKNPCKDSQIPYYLAFIYYYYMHEPEIAANYYKIASANDDSLEWNKVMAAIMQWKWWDREKAYFMFLNIADSLAKENKVCKEFSNKLKGIWSLIFTNKLKLDWKLLENIKNTREKVFWKFNPNEQQKKQTDCENYINKATRELNLEYIERANEKYKKDNNWKNAKNAKVLLDEKYIDYLPIDYQQEKDYWIIYIYNKDTWHFDYDMWNY